MNNRVALFSPPPRTAQAKDPPLPERIGDFEYRSGSAGAGGGMDLSRRKIRSQDPDGDDARQIWEVVLNPEILREDVKIASRLTGLPLGGWVAACSPPFCWISHTTPPQAYHPMAMPTSLIASHNCAPQETRCAALSCLETIGWWRSPFLSDGAWTNTAAWSGMWEQVRMAP